MKIKNYKTVITIPGVFSLNGKLALITGGGTGIGLGISKTLIAAGAWVIIRGRREEILKDAVAEPGEDANYIVFDITDKQEIFIPFQFIREYLS